MPPSVNPTTYSIELRDKSGNLKNYLAPFASNLSWDYKRLGGCGDSRMTINKAYRSLEIGSRDDIQIRVKSGATSKLVYRGFIENIISSLKIPQTIAFETRGYSELLKKIGVQANGDTKTYEDMEISEIVDDIIDTFVTPNSPITKGTIDTSNFSVDSIQFRGNVYEALQTLAELVGNVEYGVNENLQFFWRTENTSIRERFFVGDNISILERRINYSKLVNKIYLQGGDIEGVPYLRTAENTDSQVKHYLAEQILMNSSIITDTVADQYLGALLRANSDPEINIKVKVNNVALRLEDTVPIGMISVFDPDYEQSLYKWGTTANGGDNLIWGRTINGGSGKVWGGAYKAQIDKITYAPSDTDERFNLEIQFGDTILETAAKLNRIEQQLSSLRQRS